MINVDGFKNTGWICPKCGRVMAPHIAECVHCNKVEEVVINPCTPIITTVKVTPGIDNSTNKTTSEPITYVQGIADTTTTDKSTNKATITTATNDAAAKDVKEEVTEEEKEEAFTLLEMEGFKELLNAFTESLFSDLFREEE